MKKLIILLLALCSFTYAGNTTIESEEKIMAIEVLKKYSQTVACSTNFDMEKKKSLSYFLKNVFTIERDAEYGTATYFVL